MSPYNPGNMSLGSEFNCLTVRESREPEQKCSKFTHRGSYIFSMQCYCKISFRAHFKQRNCGPFFKVYTIWAAT